MAAIANQINKEAVNAALDQEFIKSFQGDADRLMEILGIFGVETIHAGSALKMLTVTGTLNNDKTDASTLSGTGAVTLGSSSGSKYVDGDEVALSKFNAKYETVGEAIVKPYRKMTTQGAIQKAGYEASVLKTDTKMLSLVRNAVIAEFFEYIAKGTGEANGKGLQSCMAAADAVLGNKMEENGDATDRIVHFVNREDAAAWLGNATVTTQNAFGMTYMQNFLGVTDVFLTGRVKKGTMYATPAENIHIFGVDFGELSRAGLEYAATDNGLIGVAHAPAYDHVSVETNVLAGMLVFPEVKDYIIKGTIAPLA